MQKEFTTPFKEISPQELNKCLQKCYLSARKSDNHGHSVIVRQNKWQTENELKIIIFVLNYVTVLVYSYFEKGCWKKCARDSPERKCGI